MKDQLEQALLEQALQDAYERSIPHMSVEQPEKIHGERDRIYAYGFCAFRVGFIYGMSAGLEVKKEIEEDGKYDSGKIAS